MVNRTSDEIIKIISKQLGPFMEDYPAYCISDEQYHCPTIKEVQKILTKSKLNSKIWLSEKFDCDDFALALKYEFIKNAWHNKKRKIPYSVGIINGDSSGEGYHAINFVICDDGKLYLIEPQTDEMFLPSRNFKDIYFIYI